MEPFASPRREFSCASVKPTQINVEGKTKLSIFYLFFNCFSFDGAVVQNHANSTHGHRNTSLGKYKGEPFALGGYSNPRWIAHAEIYNNVTNTWNAIEDYPYQTE